jgi:hypothetical protein
MPCHPRAAATPVGDRPSSHAVLENVAPGRYQMCNTECTTVDIAPSPERQSVTLAENSDDPPEPDPDEATANAD